ncbi:MAG: hypothetical protein PVG22_16185 [Chromatiales bacterium]|jgi:hypothetical protein
MLFGFTILDRTREQTTLAIEIEYKAKPVFLTPLMAGKMRRLAHDVLLGYKHFIEAGEKRIPIKKLRKHYRNMEQLAVQYG